MPPISIPGAPLRTPLDVLPGQVATDDPFLAGYLALEGMRLVAVHPRGHPLARWVFEGPGVFEKTRAYDRGEVVVNLRAVAAVAQDLEERWLVGLLDGLILRLGGGS